jgi:small subunit ribosomal protein S4
MPKRKRKVYSRPRKPFDKPRIEEENVLKEKYGLKNKREIWKADTAIARIRNLAKHLIIKSDEEKKAFIDKLKKKGFKIDSIPDSLALNKEDWLKRRLETIVAVKKLANTPKQARQFIVHKHVLIGDRIINIPSYQVSLEEEPLIRLNIVLKQKETKKSKLEEIKEEITTSEKIEEESEVEREIA